jgi:cell division protease FtsH
MGGRVAEELVFGRNKVTAGAASDIEQATKIARHMVTQWGMSDELGPVGYSENQQEIFLGHSVTQSKNVSEATAQTIDREIRRIVEEGHSLARSTLAENRHHLDRIAQGLLEHETLSGDDITAIMRGEPLANVRRDDYAGSGTTPGKRSSVPTTRPSGGEPPAGIEPSPQPGA